VRSQRLNLRFDGGSCARSNPLPSLDVDEIVVRFPRLFLAKRALREPSCPHSVSTLLSRIGSCVVFYQLALSLDLEPLRRRSLPLHCPLSLLSTTKNTHHEIPEKKDQTSRVTTLKRSFLPSGPYTHSNRIFGFTLSADLPSILCNAIPIAIPGSTKRKETPPDGWSFAPCVSPSGHESFIHI
jgi:hypothetical protein